MSKTHFYFCVMKEEQLVTRILEGDEVAFEILFKEYHLKILNLCYAMLHNRDEAEDLTQEVFLEVYRSIDKFRGKSQLSTWIYRIAVNKSINQTKKNKLRRFFSLESDSVIGTKSFEQTDWSLEDKQYNNYLHQALDKLPTKQKKAFVLFAYDQLPQKEIAEIMNCSLQSVEILVYRARKSIQKYIESIDKEIFK